MTGEGADPPPSACVFAFEGVEKRYGNRVAVQDVSFGVACPPVGEQGSRGRVLGLLGPNGAGKTSLIRILMDILRPTRGVVWLFGRPLERSALDRVGYLPEERGLYNKLKVVDVLVYFGRLKGLERRDARRRAERWLERIGLAEEAAGRVDRLSKGMSQKVQIVGTLMAEPELCVLDEPFSGLDPVNVRLVKDLIDERRARGLTTVLSTHQMNMVEEICDEVALIHRGRLRVRGTVAEVREAHSPLEVEVTALAPLPQVDGVETLAVDGRRTRLRLVGDRTPGDLLRRLVESGVEVEGFERRLATMEQVFLHAVGDAGDDSSRSSELAVVEGAP